MKILVLGHTGMLGHIVFDYLHSQGYDVTALGSWRWNLKRGITDIEDELSQFDFVINCIGNIPQKYDVDADDSGLVYAVNWLLPMQLLSESHRSGFKVIHPDTDWKDSDEDPYYVSKRILRESMGNFSDRHNFKILRTSMIGPELKTNYSLFSWICSLEGSFASGYSNVKWNGITTLEWAKQAETLMLDWDSYDDVTILEGTNVSKYKLLSYIIDVFELNVGLVKIRIPDGVDRCLVGDIKTPHIKKQLIELKNWIDTCY